MSKAIEKQRLPIEITSIRHGISEPNIIQNNDEQNQPHPLTGLVNDRPDYLQRLSLMGVDQAALAREWLVDNGFDPVEYDERYVSSHNRTLETAAVIGATVCDWLVDDRIIERDWAHFGSLTIEEQAEQFPRTVEMKEKAAFFARLDGGESPYDAKMRVRDFYGTLSREMSDKRVMTVVHGDIMWVMRSINERMTPHEYHEAREDKSQRISNCTIMINTRRNPEDPSDVRSAISDGWRRMIDPVDESRSPFGGEWVKLPGKRRYSGAELLHLANQTPRLMVDERRK